METNVFANFYGIQWLPFQNIENPKRRGRMDGRTDGQRENIYPTNTVCGAGIIINHFNLTFVQNTEHLTKPVQ